MKGGENSRQIQPSRQKLLDAAKELFYEDGYAATTLARISERSGVNNGLITYYFGSKCNLAREIYNLMLMDVRAEISMELFRQRKDKEYDMALNIAVENRVLLAQKFDNPNLLRFYNEYQKDRDFYVVPNEQRERYYELQKELVNPNITDIDLKLYEVCGIAVVKSVTEAYEKQYLDCDIDYLKDYVIYTLLNMLQLTPFRVSALMSEARHWEERLKIRIDKGFRVVVDKG